MQPQWKATQDFFGVQSRAKEDFLCQMFQTTRKGNSKMEDYLCIMKTHADNLGRVGSQVLLGFILFSCRPKSNGGQLA